MAYDHNLASRIRSILGDQPGLVERPMFGGLTFMLDGNMACGVIGEDLMVRVGPAAFDDAIGRPHARVMDFTGKPARGAVYVAPAGVATDDALSAWVDRGVAYARSLPRKA